MIERNQDNADVPAASPSFRMSISQHFLLYQTLPPLSDTRKPVKVFPSSLRQLKGGGGRGEASSLNLISFFYLLPTIRATTTIPYPQSEGECVICPLWCWYPTFSLSSQVLTFPYTQFSQCKFSVIIIYCSRVFTPYPYVHNAALRTTQNMLNDCQSPSLLLLMPPFI